MKVFNLKVINNINTPDLFFGTLIAHKCNSVATIDTLSDKIQTNISLLKQKYTDYNRKEFICTEPICHYVQLL